MTLNPHTLLCRWVHSEPAHMLPGAVRLLLSAKTLAVDAKVHVHLARAASQKYFSFEPNFLTNNFKSG